MKTYRFLIGALVIVALALLAAGRQASLAAGTTIYVDTDAIGTNDGTSWTDAFTTLQPALDAASSEDQIWVAAGIYTPTAEIGGSGDRYKTFQMKNGVAIYGGFDPTAGDIAWEDRDWEANPAILSGDLNGDDGPDFANNDENSYNVFYHADGTVLDSSAILDGFTISGGNANLQEINEHYCGSGMNNDFGSSPTLHNITFENNWAGSYGGAMFNMHASAPALTNVTFTNNEAGDTGGGLFNWGSSPVLIDCIFTNNSTTYNGGGLTNWSGSSPELINCTVANNSAGWDGGGMYNNNSSPELTNCTFAGNSAEDHGGGIYNANSSAPVLTNCILWSDTPEEISNTDSSPVITYSDIQGGYTGTGNINADPLFAEALYGDYHLSSGSPCIDVGNNAAPDLPPYDFEGDARILDGDGDETAIVDMGVDEHQVPPVIFVDQEATGANDGTSWTDAFTNLQPALSWAISGVEIWVAEGTYRPSWESSPGDPRSATFQMKNGVAIYGGFDPTAGDIAWEDRDWEANPTILSGDIGIEDDNSDNSYHVFYHPLGTDLDSSAILDGFTITGGLAVEDLTPYQGGGMYNRGSSPTLTNCTFASNSAGEGGGMYNAGGAPALANCTFTNNNAYLLDTPGFGHGGGMYNAGGAPALTNCTFENNTAWYGGGMYNAGGAPALTNCIFENNLGVERGGGMQNHNSSPALTNCTFAGNSGGGMYNQESMPNLTNCILWGNSPYQISNDLSTVNVIYSDVQGGYTGVGNINLDPLFVDAANGDLRLQLTSPAIDAGDNATPGLAGVTTDLGGHPRFADVLSIADSGSGTPPIVDMGAYEAPPETIFVDREATGTKDASSWANAFTDLEDALSWAVSSVEIWVAEGTYTPTVEHGGTSSRHRSFQLKNGVALYGGFDPTVGDIAWEDRDWVANPTILSGDLNGDDGSAFANNDENSYHVFYHFFSIGLDSSAILDGFTITGGNANNALYDQFGGGMINWSSSPTLSNITFIGNSAIYGGGGMSNLGSTPSLSNVVFVGNSASSGGGMFNSPPLQPDYSSASRAAQELGVMIASGSSPTLTNVTFAGNSASTHGGGMYNYKSEPVLTNCILWGNTPEEIYNTESSPIITYSDIQGGYSGTGNINLDPLFVDLANGDIHLGTDSPCIDAGDNAAPDLPLYDFEGDARILDGDGDGTATVDMGADEVVENLQSFFIYLPVVLNAD